MSTNSEKYQPKGAVTKEIMELPRHQNGDVDWNTLGNILVAYDLGEVLCASYVDRLYGKEDPGFKPITDWRFLYKEKDVVVLWKQLPDSPIQCYMGRSVVDLPASTIHGFLGINESAHYFDRFVVQSKLIKSLRDEVDIKDGICYMQHESKHCLVKAKRDFVFYSRWEAMSDGKCVLSALSIDYPDYPLVPGVTRGQFRPGSGWILEPYMGDPNRTLVSHIVHVDLVSLPPIITNRVMRRVPLSVHYLREHLNLNRPPTPSHLPLVTPNIHDRQPELPTSISPQIPTPNAQQGSYCSLSSFPMESNPLYQSSNLYMGSARLRTQSQESWRFRGVDNEVGIKPTRKVPTVPEEEEEEVVQDLSATLVKIETELDTSHGFPAPFEMTTTSTDSSLAKIVKQSEGEQWLLVQAPIAMGRSPSPSKSVKGVEDTVTPDVSPGNSQGNEWTVASSNNE
ncbi:uncharacterized protein LOC135348986 [Halichondria panicea]|uniref:uncharacterized protein LOC135348986 n=1 Tax=Halichondria panicea TaxID=6063 RepID=UPI00312B8FA4